MLEFDPFICYEDLESNATKEVIEFFNREIEGLLGDDVKRSYDTLLEYVVKPLVTSATLVDGGVVVTYRGLDDSAVYISYDKRKTALIKGSEERIPVSVERVEGASGLVAVNTSVKGSDESIIYIVDVGGSVKQVIQGMIEQFLLREGALYYVKTYRKEKPPDGGDVPTDRVVKLINGEERIIWGSNIVGSGEAINLAYSPDYRKALVTVHRGWSRSKLYLIDLETGSWEFLEGGDYSILLAGWGKEYAYVRKKPEGDEIVIGDRVFKVERPVQYARIAGDKLLAVELINASHRVKLYDLDFRNAMELFKGERFTVSAVDGLKDKFLVLRTSFDRSYELDVVEQGTVRVVDEGIRVEGVKVLDLWVESFDGTKVHGFLASKGESVKGVVIYGYGGFNISQTPRYTVTFHHLMNLGYAIALVNIRGGGEEGEAWHRAGMLKNKENTFKDFASFARFFKSLGLKVVGYGISNGGLTVGAVITKWPELLDVAVIGYPVLDMLRYHKLYVGKYWVPEYGDPEDPEMREYLLSYSPYHNIPRDKKLPPTLVYTGLSDDRVHPAHAIKFAVKARLLGHPVYLRVEPRAGHRGAQWQILALQTAYIISFIEKHIKQEATKHSPQG